MVVDRGSSTGSMRDSVRETIRDLVIGGDLRPGDRLVERQLAERLGVSRVPVREALTQLAHEGLVDNRPTGGMRVRLLDSADVEDLFEIRGALEPVLCRLLIAQVSDHGLDRLDQVVADTRTALARTDHGAAVKANVEFHQVLVELADSPVLAAVMQPVAGRMRWLLSRHEDPHAMCEDHAAIAAALRRRDLDATLALCVQHLAVSRAAVTALAAATTQRSPS